MDKIRQKEQGATLVSWLFVIGFVGTFIILSIRVLPLYLESMSVGSALSAIAEDPAVRYASESTIVDMLARRFQVNSVRNVNAKDLKLEKRSGQISLSVDYEVRLHALYNIDFVLVFNKSVQVE